MCAELVNYQPKNVNETLLPLLTGKPVAMLVTDEKLLKKKRIGTPVLFITPTECYGLGHGSLVLAMQGYGCEVMPKGEVKAQYLFRLGLTMRAAKMLTQQLNDMWRTE